MCKHMTENMKSTWASMKNEISLWWVRNVFKVLRFRRKTKPVDEEHQLISDNPPNSCTSAIYHNSFSKGFNVRVFDIKLNHFKSMHESKAVHFHHSNSYFFILKNFDFFSHQNSYLNGTFQIWKNQFKTILNQIP